MKCTEIQIISSKANAAYVSSDGNYYLDLPEDFSFRFSKQLEEVNELGEFRIEGVLDFSLPRSHKNDFFLLKHLLPNVKDQSYAPETVLVYMDERVHRESKMYVREGNSGNYECSIVDRSHWLPQLEGKKLRDLDLGTFIFSESLVFTRMLQPAYQDTDDYGFNFPFNWYGNFYNSSVKAVTAYDLRPCFYPLYLLREIFNQFTDGWRFACPVLESDTGRTISNYLLGEDFRDAADKDLNALSVLVRLDTEFDVLNFTGDTFPLPNTQTTVIFDAIVFDPSYGYNTIEGHHTTHAFMDYEINLKVLFNRRDPFFDLGFDSPEKAYIQLILLTAGGTVIILDEIEGLPLPESAGYIPVTLKSTAYSGSQGAPVLPDDKVYVRVGYSGSRSEIKNLRIGVNSTFFGKARTAPYSIGDTVNTNLLIDNSYTAIDYLKGNTHLFNWKFDTDFNRKLVTAYTPFDVEYYGDSLQGYFLNTLRDITPKVTQDSELTKIDDIEGLDRYVLLAFKDGNDQAIEQLQLDEANPLYSKLIDFGSDLKDSTLENRNPFFEPTLNSLVTGISEDGFPLELAQMIDNKPEATGDKYSQVSYKIGARVFFLHLGEQYINSGSWLPVNLILLDNPNATTFLWGYQKASAIVENDGTTTLTKYLGYGDQTGDHFDLFYRDWYRITYITGKLNILALIKVLDYFDFSFRYKYAFEYLGRYTVGYLKSISDFEVCSAKSTPLEFFHDKGVTADNYAYTPTIDPCQDEIDFAFLQTALCWDITGVTIPAGTSAINTTYLWKYIDEVAYTDITISAQVCSPIKSFEFKVIIELDDGCVYTRQKFVHPCSDNVRFNLVYDDALGCLTPFIYAPSSAVDTATIVEYSINDGVDWFEVVGCLPIDLGVEYLFRADVLFLTGCETRYIEASYTLDLDDIPLNCDDLVFEVACEDAGNGTIVFSRTNSNIPNVVIDLIKWRNIDAAGDPAGDGRWYHWDEITPVSPFELVPELPCRIEVVRVLMFRNNICPPLYSPIVICNCT